MSVPVVTGHNKCSTHSMCDFFEKFAAYVCGSILVHWTDTRVSTIFRAYMYVFCVSILSAIDTDFVFIKLEKEISSLCSRDVFE